MGPIRLPFYRGHRVGVHARSGLIVAAPCATIQQVEHGLISAWITFGIVLGWINTLGGRAEGRGIARESLDALILEIVARLRLYSGCCLGVQRE